MQICDLETNILKSYEELKKQRFEQTFDSVDSSISFDYLNFGAANLSEIIDLD